MTELNDAANGDNGKKARILLADDSKLVRVSAVKMLATQFDLVLAEDGEDAWQKICDDDTIQVVFTDLGMPKLDGYGLIRRMRESDNEGIRNQPIIVITGASEDEGVRRQVFELGATDFITKPFKSTELIARAEAHASYRRDTKKLQKAIDIDLLTGTLNQSGLFKQLEKDISFVNRHGENLALILFELDHFKSIHDRIGESGTHKILQHTADALLGAIRREDSIGRFGPDQFLAILPMAKTDGAIILAKRISARIKTFKITVAGETLPVSISAGVAVVRKGEQAAGEKLLHLAEKALHNAKMVGPGEVQLLKLETHGHTPVRVVVSVDKVLEAMEAGNFEVREGTLDAVVERLKPLVALLSEEQRGILLKRD